MHNRSGAAISSSNPLSLANRLPQHFASFLVRLWHEPREVDNAVAPVRAYVRHLQTGEEFHTRDTSKIIEFIMEACQRVESDSPESR